MFEGHDTTGNGMMIARFSHDYDGLFSICSYYIHSVPVGFVS